MAGGASRRLRGGGHRGERGEAGERGHDAARVSGVAAAHATATATAARSGAQRHAAPPVIIPSCSVPS
jgi:hypothetical protein